MNFEIDSGVQALLPQLSSDERDRLDQSIYRTKRIRDAVIIAVLAEENSKRILADGHNRLEIGTKYKLQVPTEDMHFQTRAELYQWIIDNQLGRRNLTDERRAYYLGKEYNFAKQERGDVSRFSPKCQRDTLGESTAEKVAEKHNVSSATIIRDGKFAEAVDALPEAIKEQVLSGESGVSKKQIMNGVVPKLCKKCKSLPAPVAGCQECRALRFKQTAPKPAIDREPGDDTEAEADEKARDKARPKVGAVTWDKKVFEEPYGRLVRAVDQLYKAYGQITEKGAVKADAQHKGLMGVLSEFQVAFTNRQKELSKLRR